MNLQSKLLNRRLWFTTLLAVFVLSFPSIATAASIEYLQAKPLFDSDTLKGVHLKPVKAGALKVPLITWPGDVATIYTEQAGLFKKEGLDVQLFLENDFAKQVKGVLEGETPLLRGTMGMVNAAAETFDKQGTDLVVIYQLTWSTGGDCLVVRPGVKSLTDLKGKNIALQLYGPHMDYLTTVLKKAGLKPTDVHTKWLKELSIPSYDAHGKILDPRSAFEHAPDLDGAMVISPDASALTSGGTGTGAEGSVKGARTLFSSKSANRVIADVYACRADYFKANRAKVEKFVHALMLGQDQFSNLMAHKSAEQAQYKKLVASSAVTLFGSPQATGDVEGSLGGDCEWVGYQGNIAFFTGAGTTRSFVKLKDEIQSSFTDIGLIKGKAPLQVAGWDYKNMAAGLGSSAKVAEAPAHAFDTAKTQRTVEKQIAGGKWQNEGSLYSFEIYFAPRQAGFSPAQYSDAFKKALELSQTLGGTLITIEGHNAPDALSKAKSSGASPTQIALIEQAAKNLSYQRAVAVRQAYLDFCKKLGVTVDESQFLAVGMGATSPKFPTPQTEEQWNANRRVVFRVKSVETELDSFKPAGK